MTGPIEWSSGMLETRRPLRQRGQWTHRRGAAGHATMRLMRDEVYGDECLRRVVSSTGHCNTARSLSAGVSNPKVCRGR